MTLGNVLGRRRAVASVILAASVGIFITTIIGPDARPQSTGRATAHAGAAASVVARGRERTGLPLGTSSRRVRRSRGPTATRNSSAIARRFVHDFTATLARPARTVAIDDASPGLRRALLSQRPSIRLNGIESQGKSRIRRLHVISRQRGQHVLDALVDDGRRRFHVRATLVKRDDRWQVVRIELP